jgi:FlaA1/EpsC-like NDP-sugar epimerase
VEETLLKRDLENVFKNKKILVTGGTGCIGSIIVKNLLKYKPEVVRIFSNDEDATFRMMEEIGREDDRRFLVGDIRDRERLIKAMEDVDIVYHAAALKHVPLCEYNPFEAIKTNVMGTQNLIDAALINNVSKVINISTDKAVNPINTMGATKLLAEKLIIDANYYKGQHDIVFSCVRFGNVLFSRGSVVPVFENQIKEKKMITITDENMTRFMMAMDDTIDLVFKATLMAKYGEIFILKMPVIKLGDLSDVVIENYAKKYGYKTSEIKKISIGPRPGEKMFEELMTESESDKALETEDMFIIPPQREVSDINYGTTNYQNSKIYFFAKQSKSKGYKSNDVTPISKKEINRLLFKMM